MLKKSESTVECLHRFRIGYSENFCTANELQLELGQSPEIIDCLLAEAMRCRYIDTESGDLPEANEEISIPHPNIRCEFGLTKNDESLFALTLNEEARVCIAEHLLTLSFPKAPEEGARIMQLCLRLQHELEPHFIGRMGKEEVFWHPVLFEHCLLIQGVMQSLRPLIELGNRIDQFNLSNGISVLFGSNWSEAEAVTSHVISREGWSAAFPICDSSYWFIRDGEPIGAFLGPLGVCRKESDSFDIIKAVVSISQELVKVFGPRSEGSNEEISLVSTKNRSPVEPFAPPGFSILS